MSFKFDLEAIPEDEGLTIDLNEKRETLGINQQDCALVEDIKLTGKMTRVGLDVFFNGRVNTILRQECSRCLELFDTPVEVSLSTCFLPQPEDAPPEEKELHASDIEVEYYRENTIDLAQPVFDQILLTQPLIPLCQAGCKGLCVQCGVNRNQESCRCESEISNVDPRLAVLEKLKEKIK